MYSIAGTNIQESQVVTYSGQIGVGDPGNSYTPTCSYSRPGAQYGQSIILGYRRVLVQRVLLKDASTEVSVGGIY